MSASLPALRAAAGRIAFVGLLGVLVLAGILALRPGTFGIPINQVVVAGNSMEPTLSNGDLVVTRRRDGYRRGDVVAYRAPSDEGRGPLVIHRIVAGDDRRGFVFKGDNRTVRDPWQVTSEHVLGESVLHVPKVGLVFSFLRGPLGFAALAALFSFFFVVRPARPQASG